jgi:hypothetical protein
MKNLVTSWNLKVHRGRVYILSALILAMLLSATAASASMSNRRTSRLDNRSSGLTTDLSVTVSMPQPASASRYLPSAIRNLRYAARCYNDYQAIIPDDLLGLRRLAEVCTTVEELGLEDESCQEAALRVSGSRFQVEPEASPAAVLRNLLEARTDDRHIMAELLQVPVEDVKLGPNLLENGGFEDWNNARPIEWEISNMATGAPWNRGQFVEIADRFVSWEETAGRIAGLWLEQSEDKEPGRSGYLYSFSGNRALPYGSCYVLSFYYRTEGLLDRAVNVWAGSSQDIPFDHRLPSTNGEWRRFVVVGCNYTSGINDKMSSLLIRSFSPGQVWFDEVRIHEVQLAAGTRATSHATKWVTIGGK